MESPPRGWGRLVRLASAVAGSQIPPVLAIAAMAVLMSTTLLDYAPVRAEETLLWHRALAVSEVGFQPVVYSGVASEWVVGSPVHLAIVGAIGILIDVSGLGPRLAIVPMLMMGAFTVLAFIGLVIARQRPVLNLLAGMVFALFPTGLLYLGTGTTEPLHHGIALLLGALTVRSFETPTSSGWRTAVVLVAVLAALIRPVWFGVAFLAVFSHPSGVRGRVREFGAVVVGVLLSGLLLAAGGGQRWVDSPEVGDRVIDAFRGLDPLAFRENFALDWVLLGLAVVAVSTSIAFIGVARPAAQRSPMPMVVLWSLGFGLAITMPYAGSVGAARVLGPLAAYALTVGMLGSGSGTRVAQIGLLVGLVALPFTVTDYRERNGVNFVAHESVIIDQRNSWEALQEYDAIDPWCRSVLLTTGDAFFDRPIPIEFFYQLASIPPGTGIVFDQLPLRTGTQLTGWVVAEAPLAASLDGYDLELIASGPLRGSLYRNKSALGCD